MMELLDVSALPEDHPALVPDFWLRAMLSHPEVTPADAAAALAGAGLPEVMPEHGHVRLTQVHEAMVLELLAERLGDPAFGARVGTSYDPHIGSILSYIAFASADLREMLSLLIRYLPITRSQSRVMLDETGLGATVEMGFGDASLAGREQYGEFAVGAILGTIRAAVGINVPIDWVAVACPQRLEQGVLDSIYRCRVRRETTHFAIALPTEALQLPVQGSDENLLHHLTAYGDILLEKRKLNGPSVLEEVEGKIVSRLSFGAPSLADVADQLGVSARTLARRLEREGHSFREVLERLRYDLARSYLADRRLPLAEIAFLLGFADQSSFGTAFLRWSGFTPGHYRRTL